MLLLFHVCVKSDHNLTLFSCKHSLDIEFQLNHREMFCYILLNSVSWNKILKSCRQKKLSVQIKEQWQASLRSDTSVFRCHPKIFIQPLPSKWYSLSSLFPLSPNYLWMMPQEINCLQHFFIVTKTIAPSKLGKLGMVQWNLCMQLVANFHSTHQVETTVCCWAHTSLIFVFLFPSIEDSRALAAALRVWNTSFWKWCSVSSSIVCCSQVSKISLKGTQWKPSHDVLCLHCATCWCQDS